MPASGAILDYVTSQAPLYGVPTNIALNLVGDESRGNPSAVSPKGATGVMQLMPGTAKDMGVADSTDYRQNITGGLKYLQQLYKQFGSWPLALRAYNAGPGRVEQSFSYPGVNKYVADIMGTPGSDPLQAALATQQATTSAAMSDPLLKRILAATKAQEPQRQAAATKVQSAADQTSALAGAPAPALPDAPALQDAPTPPKAPKTDPYQVFGQFMPMLIAFGGLATRGGGTAALKAATAAMNGQHEKDIEAYQNARQEWLDETEKVTKHNANQLDQFRTIMDRDDLSIKERLAQIQGLAASAGLTKDADAIRSGDLTLLNQLWSTRQTAVDHLDNMVQAERSADIQRDRLPIVNQVYEQALKDGKTSEEAMRMASEASGMMNVRQAAAIQKGIRDDLEKGPLGKAYSQLDQFQKPIDEAESAVKAGQPLGAIQQQALLDAYQKIITGGNAIRGFQVKLALDHGGLADKMARLTQQLGKGGPLSPRQIQDIVDVVHAYSEGLTKEYDSAIERGEKDAEALGQPGSSVVPFAVDPATVGAGAAPQQAIDLLKSNPTPQMKAHFDEVFGPGAADSALGQ